MQTTCSTATRRGRHGHATNRRASTSFQAGYAPNSPLPGAHRELPPPTALPTPSLNDPNSASSGADPGMDVPMAPRMRGVVKVRRGPVPPAPPPPAAACDDTTGTSSQCAGMAAAVVRYCVRTCWTSAAVATSGRMTIPYRNSASSTADGSASLNMACNDDDDGKRMGAEPDAPAVPPPTATPLPVEKEPNPAALRPGDPGAPPAANEPRWCCGAAGDD